jgi:uncharacterized DUF497 family protein
MLRFDWDERKNKGNRSKHGVWLEEAQSVLSDPHARLFHDSQIFRGRRSVHPARTEFSGKNAGRRSLLQGVRFRNSDHFCAEGNQEGDSIS